MGKILQGKFPRRKVSLEESFVEESRARLYSLLRTKYAQLSPIHLYNTGELVQVVWHRSVTGRTGSRAVSIRALEYAPIIPCVAARFAA